MAVTFVDGGKLSLGYAMEAHGTLSIVDVDFKVASIDPDKPVSVVRAPDAPSKWFTCVADATRVAVAKLRKRP